MQSTLFHSFIFFFVWSIQSANDGDIWELICTYVHVELLGNCWCTERMCLQVYITNDEKKYFLQTLLIYWILNSNVTHIIVDNYTAISFCLPKFFCLSLKCFGGFLLSKFFNAEYHWNSIVVAFNSRTSFCVTINDAKLFAFCFPFQSTEPR